MTRRAARGLAVVAAVAAAHGAAAGPGDLTIGTGSGTGSGSGAPVLSISPAALDLGAIEVSGAAATSTVHLGNTGGGTVKLLAAAVLDGGTGAAADWTITAGPPCSEAIPSCVLGAGQTTDLAIAFDPRSIGVRDVALLVNYHDTADRAIAIPLGGVGVGPTLDLVAAPGTLDFGAVPVGATATLVLPATNHGTRTLGDARATVTAGGPFAVTPGMFSVTTAAATPIAISCTPTAAGTFTAKLQLSAPDAAAAPAEIALRCAGDAGAMLAATPPAILLGEVRLGTPAASSVSVTSRGAPIALTAADLETAIAGVTVRGTPATTPATLDLVAAPPLEGSLDDRVIVTPAAGASLAIPVAGAAVTASYIVPDAVSLGTFCVQQSPMPRILALTSTGSATIRLSAPALAGTSFDLRLVAPLGYPNLVASHQRALVLVTPRPRGLAGTASDDLVWTTDVAGAITSHTTVTASFLDDGGAIAPAALAYGQTPIHIDTRNAQRVTLQNCSTASFQLDTPQVPAPFSIDSPGFPAALNPGEIATFSVGFHPTKLGPVTKTLSITSPQLPGPLTVELSGEGVTPSGDGDTGPDAAGLSSTSFYACGGCASDDPSGLAAIVLAALATRLRRRAPSTRAAVLRAR